MADLKRSTDFMQAPAGGWLHDDSALTAGSEGIFYSFPVFYCGSLELRESLRLLDMNSQTELTREIMALVAEAAGARSVADRPVNQELRTKFKKYLSGHLNVGQVEVSFCISSTTMAIGPPQDIQGITGSMNQFFAMHDMRTVSLAAGGEMRDYELVAYIAKDGTGVRECHVFDCGPHCDEVLTTIGQAFVLAQQTQAKAAAAPVLDALYEKTEKPEGKAVKADEKKKAIVQGLNKLDTQRRSVRAQAPALRPTAQVKQAKEVSPTELEQLKLRDAEEAAKARPSWVCAQADTIQKISLDDLRRQLQATKQEVVEIEEED
eukprot:m.18060 g.18060  ORF g.18060 m.18060 type:complete len:320 (-) comp7291_c0_seq1:33-992(-)